VNSSRDSGTSRVLPASALWCYLNGRARDSTPRISRCARNDSMAERCQFGIGGMQSMLRRVVSRGRTGVDRAVLGRRDRSGPCRGRLVPAGPQGGRRLHRFTLSAQGNGDGRRRGAHGAERARLRCNLDPLPQRFEERLAEDRDKSLPASTKPRAPEPPLFFATHWFIP